MSISIEYAMEHKADPAVLCCRAEAGTALSEHNLEDPAIFDELVESGLLNLEGALSIGQVIGATLTKTADSLTPITEEMVDEAKAVVEEAAEEPEAAAESKGEMVVSGATGVTMQTVGGVLVLNIESGKGIHIELPIL